jgi:homocysteine S-methyltransferase
MPVTPSALNIDTNSRRFSIKNFPIPVQEIEQVWQCGKSMNIFRQTLAQSSPLILDGGLATELEANGHDISGDLWSAAMLQANPRAIVAAHRAYLDAGADCLITASYQASRIGFAAKGISAAAADQLILDSVALACTARDEFLAANADTTRTPLVAASIGPYGATLADGSEYTGDYSICEHELREFHEQRIRLLDGSAADLFACETIPNITEAKVLSELLADVDKPAWVCFSCKDAKRISDGNLLRDACALFAAHPKVLAVGVNCTPPQFITGLIAEALAGAPDKAIVVYPNSGETYHADDNSWSGDCADAAFGFRVAEWLQAGAQVIGGCCRTGPAEITQIRNAVGKSVLL